MFVPRGAALSPFLGAAVLCFWFVAASRVGAATAGWLVPSSRGGAALLRSVLWAYAWVILLVLTSGALKVISLPVFQAAAMVAYVVAGPARVPGLERVRVGAIPGLVRANPLAAFFVACAVLLTAVNMAWAGLCPPLHNDDLSYHLSFPVEWVQTGTLSWKFIPFGNNSPSYYPKNTELYYLWAYLPLRGLAHLTFAQLPVLLLVALSVFVLLRSLGGSVASACIGASLGLMTGPVLRFVSSAYVDLGFAALFVVLLWLLLCQATSPSRAGWLELCLGAGLFAGTKVLAVAMGTLVVFPIALWLAWPHRRALRADRAVRLFADGVAGLGVFVASGGWWYVRTWLAADNPLFPLIVEVAGFELFDGAYDRSSIPAGNPLSLLTVFVPAWGAAEVPQRLALLAPFAWGLIQTASRALDEKLARRRLLIGALVPILIGLVFATIVPYGYPRFVFSVVLFSTALLLTPLEGGLAVRRLTGVLLVLSLLATLTDATQLKALLLPYAHPALHFAPLVGVGLGAGIFVLLSGAALASLALTRRQAAWLRVMEALAGVLFLGVLWRTSDPSSEFAVGEVRRAWAPGAFLSERYGAPRVAFTGSTDSLTLYGWDQAHRVRYLHIDSPSDDRFHDRVRLMHPWRAELRGELLGHGYYRGRPLFSAWMKNLERYGAQVVVCHKLPGWVLRKRLFVRTAEGYPLEHRWATSHPESFTKVFDDGVVCIFEVLGAAP